MRSKLGNLFNLISCLPAGFDFLFLSLLLILINLPLFPRSFWYDGDTVYVFQLFYGFYTDLFFHNELARWLPFGSFGMQSDYLQLAYISPPQYLTGLIGSLLRIRDVNFLFKFAVLLQHFTLLAGMYLFCREIFKSRTAVVFACFAAIASSLWPAQINYNFRIYYLYPLVFYLVLSFYRKQKSFYLYLAGLTLIAALIGAAPQYFALYLLVFFLFFIPLGFLYPDAFRSLFKFDRKTVCCLIALIVVGAAYLYFASHMLDNIKSVVEGRSDKSYTVSLDMFLHYGTQIGAGKFLGLFYPRHPDMQHYASLYLGILPLAFILYALLRPRHPIFFIVAFLALYFSCLSLGEATPIAKITYYWFPPIRYFRYVGNLGGIIRFFFILAAGFGLDRFLQDITSAGHSAGARLRLLFCGVVLFAAFTAAEIALRHGLSFQKLWPWFSYFAILLAAAGIVLLTFKKSGSKTAGAIALLLLFADLLVYQGLSMRTWPYRFPWITPQITEVYPFKYQESRKLEEDLTPRMKEARKLVEATAARLLPEAHVFLFFDSLLPGACSQFHWARDLRMLIDTRFSAFFANAIPYPLRKLAFLSSPTGKIYSNTFGGSLPKARLTTDVLFATGPSQARELVTRLPDLGKKTVLENVSAEIRKSWTAAPHPGAKGSVHIQDYSFNQIRMEVTVENPGGAWLYYADAYQPGWRAFLNGKETLLARANLGFKALYVPPGKNVVRFNYWNDLQSLAAIILALYAILFSLTILYIVLRLIVCELKFHNTLC